MQLGMGTTTTTTMGMQWWATRGRGGVLVLSSRFYILVVWKTHPRCLITCWKVFCKWMKIYLKNGRNSTSQNVLKRPLKVN